MQKSNLQQSNTITQLVFAATILLSQTLSFAQSRNLVLNSDFEELELASFKANFSDMLQDNYVEWADTAMFWNIGERKEKPVRAKNWIGGTNYSAKEYGFSRSGNVYGHVRLFAIYPNDGYFSGCIIGKLQEPLAKGQEYKVVLYARPNTGSFSGNYLVNKINVAFLPQKIETHVFINLHEEDNRVSPENLAQQLTSFSSKKIVWTEYVKYEYKYIALGGEVYIAIGNFEKLHTDKNTIKVKKFPVGSAHYLIEDVSVTLEKSTEQTIEHTYSK